MFFKINLQHSSLLTTISLLLLLLLHSSYVSSHVFIYAGCSHDHYQPTSPFETNLNSLLSSITNSASQSSYNSFSFANNTDAAVYGLYQCRGDLNTLNCERCTQNAVGQIGLVCPLAYAASLQLEGCLVRYENSNFLGKVDTSVVFRKCSKSVSNDVEFYRRRDDVLADLEAATGFRVISLGLVEGVAQCLGDLSEGECGECLGEAVGKVKNACGSSSAADVYLGQCYARYWASGYYDSASDSSNEDKIGRTIAIIVGVLAGFAIIVVLLSLLRKAAG